MGLWMKWIYVACLFSMCVSSRFYLYTVLWIIVVAMDEMNLCSANVNELYIFNTEFTQIVTVP